jgi:predicted Rossmann fold flavoprotein
MNEYETEVKNPKIAVIGGGAAGYFAAINCAETFPQANVTLLEGTTRPLTKVRISGGGRCNVTHDCFDVATLVKNYPRGERELRGPFSKFQPRDTIEWFAKRGVELKIERDGRMFPVTNKSSTIIDCLEKAAADHKVNKRMGSDAIAKGIKRLPQGGFEITFKDKTEIFDRVLLATGSSPQGHSLAASLGHTITPLAPSLFTFEIKDARLGGLEGTSFALADLTLTPEGSGKTRFKQTGPLLITHWGLSGPAVLKLSAWVARELFAADYKAELKVNFFSDYTTDSMLQTLMDHKLANPKLIAVNDLPFAITKRFWQRLLNPLGVDGKTFWASVSKEQLKKLATELCEGIYHVTGKGEFKEEFVTCGGVSLKEVDFRTMESRVCPGLFFAGEILDIDGITGGFNFQNAWTTGWIAGQHLGL